MIQRANLDGSGVDTLLTDLSLPSSIALALGTGVLTVAMDVKPGGSPNSINPASPGVIPVAVLTTGTFDAATVDPGTVRFGATGAEAPALRAALADVDRDGDPDLVLHFATPATGIRCGDHAVALTGRTFAGVPVRATDAIKTVGCGW